MEPKIRIGTSGYSFSWNKAKPDAFEWYSGQSFNSVEINYSFYRFRQVTSIKLWRAKAPKDFTFSIKVHRSVTHYNRLKKPRSIQLWDEFLKNFEPLENKIDFWLFQMPANFKFKPENLERVKSLLNSESISCIRLYPTRKQLSNSEILLGGTNRLQKRLKKQVLYFVLSMLPACQMKLSPQVTLSI